MHSFISLNGEVPDGDEVMVILKAVIPQQLSAQGLQAG
jgi:hypothetical protein